MFRFQQFTIHDDRCAMKVGTDGVLLGAWCQLPTSSTDTAPTSPLKILDVGTGSGLIALMLAQRFPQTHITALELEVTAAQQAHENVISSPFSPQVEVKQGDYLAEDWCPKASFDVIVSNPPILKKLSSPPTSSAHKPATSTTDSPLKPSPNRAHNSSKAEDGCKSFSQSQRNNTSCAAHKTQVFLSSIRPMCTP